MKREDSINIEHAGQDSFLDVTTNIVGILIILVMVVGMRAQNPVVAEPTEQVPTADELNDLAKKSAGIEYDVRRMGQEIQATDDEATAKSKAREVLATMIAAVEKDLGDRRAQLNSTNQEDFDLRREVESVRTAVANEATELDDLKARKAPVVQVNHYPTPLSHELPYQVLFQIRDSRIVAVPADELGSDVFEDLKQGIRLGGGSEKSGVVGPRNGFELRYHIQLIAKREAIQTLYRFAIAQVEPQIGETVQEAVQPSSEMNRAIHAHSPKDTVVVLFVYPDSYDAYQHIKEELHKMSYGVAIFPLLMEEPIRLTNFNGVKARAQ
jgi:hypothetical protein